MLEATTHSTTRNAIAAAHAERGQMTRKLFALLLGR
jgi:hypothetical protein